MPSSTSVLHQPASMRDRLLLGMTLREYLRSLLTAGNAVAAVILAVGLPIMVLRFTKGLGAVSNLSQTQPWGIWVGLDVLSGVALAAGGFTVAGAVYVFGLKDYHAVARPAVLTAFLGYLFVVVGLLVDLGRPWKLPVPIVWSFGTPSVMFEVSWCVTLYTIVLAIEFAPAFFQWLNWRRAFELTIGLTIPATVAGIMLSTLHQSSLGAFFLLAPTKLHPLWYSPFLPAYFFISAVIAGLTMVIVESSLSHCVFHDRIDAHHEAAIDRITLGLGRAAAIVLFSYFFLKLQGLADTGRWDLLLTPWGGWYLVEVVGFVLLPCFVLAYATRRANVRLVRWAAGWTVLGVVLNRLNVSCIAFNWNAPVHYVPSWMEVWTSLTIITLGVLVFRWIVVRMPILDEGLEFSDALNPARLS